MQRVAFQMHPDVRLLNLPESDLDAVITGGVIDSDDFQYDERKIRYAIEEEARNQPGASVLVLSEENLSGHVYSGWNCRRNADRLRRLIPEAKILFVIRNQESYIASAYLNFVNDGGAWTFDRWIADYSYPVSSIFDKLQYHRILEYYQSLFGKENVLVLPYEMLAEQSGAMFMNSFFRFVGLRELSATEFVGKADKKINRSLSPLGARFGRAFYGITGGVTPIRRKFVKAADLVIKAMIPWQQSLKSGNRHKLISGRFFDSNRKTSELIGIDLGKYGYEV